ncbi:(2Fe-2S)-binding protein [Persephonella sp.]|uniref:(2Fe-2S)-binding protein n=1 Tax=Persephonella sp. TaxID=2060922 RepID=UPI0025CD371D|nr:(2Fe-2S)-binding protein [Persephonella sp.]
MEEIEVCICKRITLSELLEVIDSEGIKDIQTLIEKTKAGTVCKMCISPEDDPYGERDIHLSELLR